MAQGPSVSLLIQGALWAFLVLPAVPLGMGWVTAARAAAGTPGRRARLALLVLLTASLLLLLAGLVWTPVIGPDYSPRRFATSKINLMVMALATLVATRTRGPGRGALVTAGAWLTVAWLYMLAISSVV
jgi:hypothetical protein